MKREFKPNKASPAVIAATKMPALRHTLEGQPFDVTKSEVVNWLVQQPEIRQAMFGYYHDQSAIVFDAESGTWKGINS